MGFGGNISSGGADVLKNGIIIVDAINGDDGSGERGNIAKPFLTISSAYAVYQEGDLIEVLPGTYTFTSQLILATHNEVHFNFIEGSIVTGNIALSLFNSSSPSLTYFIHGRGEFRNDNAGLAGASITSAKCWIKGAKKITSVSGTLFATTNGWLNIENVDEMFTEALSSPIAFTNNPLHSQAKYGNIRNCLKIGDTLYPVGIVLNSQLSDANLFVQNCNFYSSSSFYTLSCQSNINRAKFVNCNFINNNFRVAQIQGYCYFINCYFQNNSALDTVFVDELGNENDPRSTFENCDVQNQGSGTAVNTRDPLIWVGLNRLVGNNLSLGAISGIYQAENKNHGTILVNKTDLIPGNQVWHFSPTTTPPTPGEIYTITAPDSDTISYTVLGGDTIDLVITGLFAAWVTKAAIGNNEFENWTPQNQPLPTGNLQITAINPIHNLDPDNGFVGSTDGADVFNTSLPILSGFSMVGPGKFLVDDNLIIPILD